MLLASKVSLGVPFLILIQEPKTISDPWITIYAKVFRCVQRIKSFIRKPWPEKTRTICYRFKRLWDYFFPWIPLPIRLSFGAWWLAGNDISSDALLTGNYEKAELQFVENFLRPGMTVLDIGAHYGLYTLLASKKIGYQGKVIAFEPSARERKRLLWHLWLNNCRNILIESVALGSYNGETKFFLVKGRDTGCNSLRPPEVFEPTTVLFVAVLKLDSYLSKQNIEHVDFMKVDVEGAELEVLKGATELLQKRPRPIILIEVQDIRTKPWGYKAKEIVIFLRERAYFLFKPLPAGKLEAVSMEIEDYNGNFIAIPQECLEWAVEELKL